VQKSINITSSTKQSSKSIKRVEIMKASTKAVTRQAAPKAPSLKLIQETHKNNEALGLKVSDKAYIELYKAAR